MAGAPAAGPSVRVVVLLFPWFEPLDVVGPVNVFGNVTTIEVTYTAAAAGPVPAAKGGLQLLATSSFDDVPPEDPRPLWLLVPGGQGTRAGVRDAALLAAVRRLAGRAALTLSVCTGAALLAAAGVLDGRPATTNKLSYEWVVAQGPRVLWQPKARWVDDGDVVTFAGVSAGIDMALHVVSRFFGPDTATRVAAQLEYEAHGDAAWDPFADLYPGTRAPPPAAPVVP